MAQGFGFSGEGVGTLVTELGQIKEVDYDRAVRHPVLIDNLNQVASV